MRLAKEIRTTTIIEKSKFIVCANRCLSEQEARDYIASIRKEFSDATHVCTAYFVQDIQRSNDNGEPSGTAGMPILEALKNAKMEDIVCCVVRYFGGILLGTGGLIRAYGGCTSQALKQAEKTIRMEMDCYKVSYPYDCSGALEGYLRSNTHVFDFTYDDLVHCTVETNLANFPKELLDRSRGKATCQFEKKTYQDVPFNEE